MKKSIIIIILALFVSSCASNRCGITGKKFGDKHMFDKPRRAYVQYNGY